jgi:hypothetical protein
MSSRRCSEKTATSSWTSRDGCVVCDEDVCGGSHGMADWWQADLRLVGSRFYMSRSM